MKYTWSDVELIYYPFRSWVSLSQVQLGQKVEVLNSYVESEFGIPKLGKTTSAIILHEKLTY